MLSKKLQGAAGLVGGGGGGGAPFTPPNIITTNLRHYYDAANPDSYSGSGTTWVDMGSGLDDATASGGVTYNSTDKAFTFDGVNGNFSITDTYSTNRNVGLTYIAWLRRDGTQNVKAGIVTNVTGSRNGIFFGPSGDENDLRITGASNSNLENADTNLTVPDAEWCMVAGTIGYTGQWQHKAYLGTQSAGITGGTLLSNFMSYGISVANIKIGLYDIASPGYFKGDIAMVLWYDDILNSTEITTNFNETKDRFFT